MEKNHPFFGDNPYETVPIEESIKAMDELIKEGKIHHWAVSNETSFGVCSIVGPTLAPPCRVPPCPWSEGYEYPQNMPSAQCKVLFVGNDLNPHFGPFPTSCRGFAPFAGHGWWHGLHSLYCCLRGVDSPNCVGKKRWQT